MNKNILWQAILLLFIGLVISTEARKRGQSKPSQDDIEEWLSGLGEKLNEKKEKQKEQFKELLDWLKNIRCEMNGDENCNQTTTTMAKTTTTTTAATSESGEEKTTDKWQRWPKWVTKPHKKTTTSPRPTKEDIKKKIEELLDWLRNMDEEENDQKGAKNHSKSDNMAVRSLFRDLESFVVPPGNETTPIVPVEVNYLGWWNDVWFWIFHVVGVLIIIVLIIIICVMRKQKKGYQRLI